VTILGWVAAYATVAAGVTLAAAIRVIAVRRSR
jgi:hypothetical protein